MADYILSEENVQQLFAYLEDQLDACGCDHTLRHTEQWLKENISAELYENAIEEINDCGAFVVSVDINSGMNGDTGEAELAVCSDITVTIGYVKTGLVSKNAGNYMKTLVCTDIGIVLVREEAKICGPKEPLLPGCIRCPNWLNMTIIPSYAK